MKSLDLVYKRIGPRTLYKSVLVNRVVSEGRGFSHLLVDGATRLSIDKTAHIINKGYISLGVSRTGFFPSTKPCVLTMGAEGKLIVNGSVKTGKGIFIDVGKSATLELGKNIFVNSNSTIISTTSVKIGDDTGIGWDSEIIDTDFHSVGENPSVAAPIEIGRRVLICHRVLIMKGITIGDGAVIASGSVVTHDVPPNCLVAGVPAKVVRQGIAWKY